ncbi:IS3 family transposase, partial [Tabrizicola sp. TH137]|uniref:IS3 family transposase n=1 Tax=Tabrizicola sp. TH137 TaxID=2067452 RepID=UPI0020B3F4FC
TSSAKSSRRCAGQNCPHYRLDEYRSFNSMVETFFKTIKSELIWPVAWQSRQQAENAVARYIDGFYNPVRRHSSLGFQSPIAFERKAREVS